MRAMPFFTGLFRSTGKVVFFQLFLLFLLLFLGRPDSHALVADELLVVANSAVPESLELARYYMERRAVPSANLFLVRTSTRETVGRRDYDEQIAGPLRSFLEKNDPEGKRFRCITLIYGMPLRVLPPPLTRMEGSELKDLQTALKEWTQRKNLAGKKQPEESRKIQERLADLRRKIQILSKSNWGASVDSELALVREKSPELDGWLPNRYYFNFQGKEIKNMPRRPVLVSRLDGPDPSIVRRIIDDSMYAEVHGLPGRAYFDTRRPEKAAPKEGKTLSAYERYDLAIHNTARVVRKSGKLHVVVNDKPTLFGPGEAPDAALYCGWYSLGKYVDAFTWVRGAVGFHVASSECTTLKAPGKTVWCKAMLEKGVCATVGPVAEPYLQSFPAPEVFFSCLLDGRAALAECYGVSNPFWSWQQVLIGDPLYRPFLRRGFPAVN